MLNRFLKELVVELAGEGTEPIVDILFNKKDVNEFLIAKKMELTINQVRNILYKLSVAGLVSFTRKKDKRRGWYIYYWTLNTEKCLIMLERTLANRIESLKKELHNRETKRFYVCKGCDIEVSEESALEHGFSCEECAEVYTLADNTKNIRDTKAKITKTENTLKYIKQELEKIRKKKEKKRARKEKKEKAEKENIKAKKRAAKKKAKKASKKAPQKKVKSGSKKVSKKSVKKSSKKKVKSGSKKVSKKSVKKSSKKAKAGKKGLFKKIKKKVSKK